MMEQSRYRPENDVRVRVKREIEAKHYAKGLAELGIRPTMIRATIGRGITQKDAARISEAFTPLAPSERHGRAFRVSRIRDSMSPERVAFHTKHAIEVEKLVQGGAHQADAIAAVWRLACAIDSRGLHEHTRHGVSSEEFCAVCMSLLTGGVSVHSCVQCGTHYISEAGSTLCPECCQSHALKRSLKAPMPEYAPLSTLKVA